MKLVNTYLYQEKKDLIIRLYDINSDLEEAMCDLVDQWHNDDKNANEPDISLIEYLEINRWEYETWVKNPNYLYDIKDTYRYWFDKSKSVIYDVITDEDVCLYFDNKYRNLMLKLLNKNN
jgi:hypothetical protein